jgi:hypothetical protein
VTQQGEGDEAAPGKDGKENQGPALPPNPPEDEQKRHEHESEWAGDAGENEDEDVEDTAEERAGSGGECEEGFNNSKVSLAVGAEDVHLARIRNSDVDGREEQPERERRQVRQRVERRIGTGSA